MPPFKFIRRPWLLSRPFPGNWQKLLDRRVPYYHHLPGDLKEVLKKRMVILLNEKIFEGCGGLTMTEEKRVVIAAYASVLLLGATSGYYSLLQSILLYPDNYLAPVHEEDEAGVITEGVESRQGESWNVGSVVLSWQDIRNDIYNGEGRGQNLIFHEFAHQLDDQYGITAGVDVNGVVHTPGEWNEILAKTYRDVVHQAETRKDGVLDPYGANHPVELFAVATEAFFSDPYPLRKKIPDLYRMLESFYKVDPASYMPYR